jgi:glutamate N-acetyltransferase/amino-acid N-acetyltransferase
MLLSLSSSLRASHQLRSSWRTITPSLARSMASKPTPDKSHLVTSYNDLAFPRGFQVASSHCGIKKKAGVLDLGVLVSTSETACSAAACFTRNVFKAAPVQVSNEILKRHEGKVKGFIVNSGCANAVTGTKGLEDAWKMSDLVTEQVQGGQGGTLVMSTGVIGQHLPITKITSSIYDLVSNLSSSSSAWLGLAKSFMTTDTFPKLRAKEFKLGDQTVRIVGIDKGAGMIHPNMGPPHGTLLGVIATDANIHPSALQSALTHAVDRSFNSISVDGDMSTNDTILCLANGAGMTGESISEKNNPEAYETFRNELTTFAEELAQLVVRDGEGATKFVTVRVENAPSYDVARKVASSVATSSLVKTALYGEGEGPTI